MRDFHPEQYDDEVPPRFTQFPLAGISAGEFLKGLEEKTDANILAYVSVDRSRSANLLNLISSPEP